MKMNLFNFNINLLNLRARNRPSDPLINETEPMEVDDRSSLNANETDHEDEVEDATNNSLRFYRNSKGDLIPLLLEYYESGCGTGTSYGNELDGSDNQQSVVSDDDKSVSQNQTCDDDRSDSVLVLSDEESENSNYDESGAEDVLNDDEPENLDGDDDVYSNDIPSIYRIETMTNAAGQSLMRIGKKNSDWHIQIDSEEQIGWKGPMLNPNVKSDVSDYYQCSICKNYYRSSFKAFHDEHTHKGGSKCPKLGCGHIGFSSNESKYHKCVPNCTVYAMKDGKIVEVQHRPQVQVYGITLARRKRRIVWVGSGSKATANECAKIELDSCAKARDRNYTNTDGVSLGCTSLCEKLYPKRKKNAWTVVPDGAFFFDVRGGTNKTMTPLKNLLRRALKAPAHCRSLSCEFLYLKYAASIFKQVFAMQKIPLGQREYLKNIYLPEFNAAHKTKILL